MSAENLPTGRQFPIAHGNQRATICEVGATIRTYVSEGVPVLEGFAADESASGGRGQLLYPWPNRLDAEPWRFSDRTARADVTQRRTGTSNHGLMRWRPFTARLYHQNRVVMAATLHPSPAYPFLTGIEVSYHLGALGLTVTTTVTNLDSVPVPFALGFHPYLAVTTPTIEGATLEVPATGYVEVNERQLPTGSILPIIGTPKDFTLAQTLSERVLDLTYTDLLRDSLGMCAVTLRDEHGRGVELSVDRNFPYVQIYTGDELAAPWRRTGLAVEPMTAPPDALRSGKDVIVLEPEQRWVGTWRVRQL